MHRNFAIALASAGMLAMVGGTALAQAPQSQDQRERAKAMELDSRDQYRVRLTTSLREKEAILKQQESTLAARQENLKTIHGKMVAYAAGPSAGATDASADPSASGGEDSSNMAKLSKDFENESYQTRIAREAVLATRRDINQLRTILGNMR